MSEERLVPKLRFRGFDDDWVKVNIKNYSTIKGRIGWKNLKQREYTESGPFLIAGKHIYNGIINWEDCDHLTEERYDESPEIALKIGDIIFSKDGSLGNPALIRELPDKATINGTMMLVRLHEKITPNFFYQVLNSNSFFRLLHILKSGSSIPHIFQRDMENFNFNVPPKIEEQNKISNFLEIIDEKIQLLEKKHQSYQDFKKYLMQQIFSQKLRFDFKNDWEEFALGDVGETYNGLSGLSKDNFEKGNSRYITYKSIFDNNVLIEDLTEPVDLNNKSQNHVEKGDLFFTGSSETPEEVGMVSVLDYNIDNCYLNSFCFGYRLNDLTEVNPIFLAYYLRSSIMRNKIQILAQGSTRFNLSKKEILKLKINIPDMEEQLKILNLMQNNDKLLKNTLNQINEMNLFKKSLLQQMFV